jgi:hypothetical protein
MVRSTDTAAWRLGQMTAADSEIWDFWVGYSRTAWRRALIRNSFSSDYRDLELMRLALSIARFGPCGLEVSGHAFRGWTSGSLAS